MRNGDPSFLCAGIGRFLFLLCAAAEGARLAMPGELLTQKPSGLAIAAAAASHHVGNRGQPVVGLASKNFIVLKEFELWSDFITYDPMFGPNHICQCSDNDNEQWL